MLKTKTCTISEKQFTITDEDMAFYKKMGVPEPTLCPEERQRRRTAFRNFRSLYRRKCDATEKMMVSMYHQEQKFPVYENEHWWSDAWDSMDYGIEIEPGKSFFDQYHALAQTVPRFAIYNLNCENCRYSNFAWMSKDCYLVFGCVRDENCINGHIVWDSKNCVDNLYLSRSEWCSECVDCIDGYDLHFSTECSGCIESYFLHDCRSCQNCFGCVGLKHKQYYFLNEKLTKEAYEEKINSLKPFSRKTLEMGRDWLEKQKKTSAIFPTLFGVQAEDCDGNHVYESKNCKKAFDVKTSEDSSYLYTAFNQIDCRDISFTGGRAEHCLDCLTLHDCMECRFTHGTFASNNMDYCEFCYECSDCFGCNGLRKKQFCILNKQYSETEYRTLKSQLETQMRKDKEWGEFFPIHHSPFAYNEAIAQEYQPLSSEEVKAFNLKWREPEDGAMYEGKKVVVSDTIDAVPDEIIGQVLKCEASGKSYRVVKEELDFYRRVGLPLPRLCPDERHQQRMKLRNPRELFDRKCSTCQCEIHTTYAPERPEKVLCEKCYQDQIQ